MPNPFEEFKQDKSNKSFILMVNFSKTNSPSVTIFRQFETIHFQKPKMRNKILVLLTLLELTKILCCPLRSL